jgi:hypothetical protein
MIIGIKQTPQDRALPLAEVFYCGDDGVAFRAAHAKLMKKNDTAKFYSIVNPLLVPLQNVVQDTTDHPDVVAANERREKLAKAGTAEKQTELAGTTA